MDHIHIYVILGIILIGISLGIFKWKHAQPVLKWIVILLSVTFLTETTAIVFVTNKLGYNVNIYKIFDMIQPGIMAAIFYFIYKNQNLKNFAIYSGIIIVFGSLVSSLIYHDASVLNNISVSLKSSYFILLSLLKYWELLSQPDEDDILKNGVFWFCSSLLFFNAVTIMYWVTHTQLQKFELAKIAAQLHLSANFIFYILIVFSIFLFQPKTSSEYLLDD